MRSCFSDAAFYEDIMEEKQLYVSDASDISSFCGLQFAFAMSLKNASEHM